MDILTHALSGAVAGTGVASLPGFRPLQRAGLIFTGTLGGIFPDIDAISLWSRFDGTFGQLFGLKHHGNAIYFGKFWYSHHAFFHSLAASILFGMLLMAIVYLVYRIRTSQAPQPLAAYFKKNIPLVLAFVLGYWMHLLGDLPTPGSVWGGIDLFWPAKNYVGGFGKIWWWNNYDIFLILLATLFINITLLTISNRLKYKAMLFSHMIILLAFITIIIQVNSRKTDYAYTGYTPEYNALEHQSKKEQQRILGHKLYNEMNKFDKWIKINF